MDANNCGISETAQFRIDILNALADIQVEIYTLRAGVSEGTPITADKLEEIHRNCSAKKK
jgi:hypothetical protein